MAYSMESLIMKQFKRSISAALLALMLATVMGCAATSTKEGTGEYVDNTVITAKVKAAIFNEPSLKSCEINVRTFKSRVELGGVVTSQANINKAIEVARGVDGVNSVKSDIRLR